jgi:restriction endonuclease S subunit
VSEATHGTKKIDLEDLKKFPICLPPEDDQGRIATILSTGDDAIAGEVANLGSLRGIKSGLSSDLLTGRVRTHLL